LSRRSNGLGLCRPRSLRVFAMALPSLASRATDYLRVARTRPRGALGFAAASFERLGSRPDKPPSLPASPRATALPPATDQPSDSSPMALCANCQLMRCSEKRCRRFALRQRSPIRSLRRTTQSGTAKSRFLAPLSNEVTLDPLKLTGDGCQDILTASQQTRRR